MIHERKTAKIFFYKRVDVIYESKTSKRSAPTDQHSYVRSRSQSAQSLLLIQIAYDVCIGGNDSQHISDKPPSNGITRRSPAAKSVLFVINGSFKDIVDGSFTSP